MKYCPNCQTTYTDDSQRFCPRDGTLLSSVSDADAGAPTVVFDDSETLVSRKPPQQVVRINVPETEPQNWAQTEPQAQNQERYEQPRIVAPPVETKKSNTALTVLATVLGMLALFSIAGAWFLLKNRKTEVAAVNTAINAAPVNRPINSNPANIPLSNVNANVEKPTPTPSATPTPKPALKPEEARAVTGDVKNTIEDWKDASENLDLDGHLNQYADTVDYYKAGKVGIAKVRADKQRAFDQYDSINFNISNMKVTPDASGDKATAVFDKEWTFDGENSHSSGKVQQQLTLGKIGGRWLITGERDLKIYYLDK